MSQFPVHAGPNFENSCHWLKSYFTPIIKLVLHLQLLKPKHPLFKIFILPNAHFEKKKIRSNYLGALSNVAIYLEKNTSGLFWFQTLYGCVCEHFNIFILNLTTLFISRDFASHTLWFVDACWKILKVISLTKIK